MRSCLGGEGIVVGLRLLFHTAHLLVARYRLVVGAVEGAVTLRLRILIHDVELRQSTRSGGDFERGSRQRRYVNRK